MQRYKRQITEVYCLAPISLQIRFLNVKNKFCNGTAQRNKAAPEERNPKTESAMTTGITNEPFSITVQIKT